MTQPSPAAIRASMACMRLSGRIQGDVPDELLARWGAVQDMATLIDREYAEQTKEFNSEAKFPDLQAMRRAVSGCAAIARHNASVAKVQGLHGDQLKSLEEYATTLRAAADFLEAALSRHSPK